MNQKNGILTYRQKLHKFLKSVYIFGISMKKYGLKNITKLLHFHKFILWVKINFSENWPAISEFKFFSVFVCIFFFHKEFGRKLGGPKVVTSKISILDPV